MMVIAVQVIHSVDCHYSKQEIVLWHCHVLDIRYDEQNTPPLGTKL